MAEGQKIAETPVAIGTDAFAPSDDVVVRWLGNGGAMVNARGTVILIDPLLEGFDMKLLVDPPLATGDVPRADAVLITHCDNDHMCIATCRDLAPVTGSFHAPRYVAGLLVEAGIPATGHDIDEEFQVGGVRIRLTPADHAWQNESPKHATRQFEMRDFCGYWLQVDDLSVWMPGDSRLLYQQLHMPRPDLILMDISDGSWHIGLNGVRVLADTYPDSVLVPIHWGCVDAPQWREFNGNPEVVRGMISNPARLKVLAPGEPFAVRTRK